MVTPYTKIFLNCTFSFKAMYVWAAVCFCCFIWLISRYSKKGIIASALLAIFVVSYAITYIQCNNKKTTEKLIKLMEHDGKHSCSGEKVDTGIWHSVTSMFGKQNNECYVKMR
jgi:glucan phosphoethanolaminetransferase (alkaline phosphatase superfamily)